MLSASPSHEIEPQYDCYYAKYLEVCVLASLFQVRMRVYLRASAQHCACADNASTRVQPSTNKSVFFIDGAVVDETTYDVRSREDKLTLGYVRPVFI